MSVTVKLFNLVLVICLSVLYQNLFAQEESTVKTDSTTNSKSIFSINVSADLVSRYVWRGQPFEQSFCVQPTLALNISNFTIGAWGSYSLVKDTMDEHDLYLVYTFETPSGNFTANVWDYHNPNLGKKFFNFKSDEGAHCIEFSLGYNGPKFFPINFLGAYNIHNDADKSTYIEIGYNFDIKDIKMNLFIGGTKGISKWYGVIEDKLAIINAGISATKTIKITDSFSLPIGVAYTMNPYIEKSFLIFKLSF
jgi:hypothetical protein